MTSAGVSVGSNRTARGRKGGARTVRRGRDSDSGEYWTDKPRMVFVAQCEKGSKPQHQPREPCPLYTIRSSARTARHRGQAWKHGLRSAGSFFCLPVAHPGHSPRGQLGHCTGARRLHTASREHPWLPSRYTIDPHPPAHVDKRGGTGHRRSAPHSPKGSHRHPLCHDPSAPPSAFAGDHSVAWHVGGRPNLRLLCRGKDGA